MTDKADVLRMLQEQREDLRHNIAQVKASIVGMKTELLRVEIAIIDLENDKGADNMTKYVFVGSEAEGYYSNSYACEGVFVEKEYYDKHSDDLKGIFSGRYFHELDGKHSEVKGDLITKEFDDIRKVVEFSKGNDVDYEEYHLTEYDDEETHSEHVKKVYELFEEVSKEYRKYTFVLSEVEYEKVKEFIEKL